MDYLLKPSEVRVLGSLIEKQIITPDYYPLTINSLIAACNQRTSRNPVTDYEYEEVVEALDGLQEKGFVFKVNIAGSRAEKFRHRMDDFAKLSNKAYALLCILMLRGPQTVGELRQRSERLYVFRDLTETEETLRGLMECEEPEPLVAELPLEPGRKEKRYVHLFSDIPAVRETEAIVALQGVSPSQVKEKMEIMELAMEELRTAQKTMSEEIQGLKKELESFKQQFE